MSKNINTLFFRLSLRDRMLFARHMEMMTRSGMQVLEALEVLKRQTTSKPFLKVLESLISDVRNGHYLSESMEKFGRLFGDFFVNLVRVGETSGTLSENFKYLAIELEKKSELNRKIRGAMAYPVVILFATLGVTGIMSFFIFPKILPVLTSLNVKLPLTTRIFVALSEFMFSYGLYLFLGLGAVIILFLVAIRTYSIRIRWHRFLLKMPFIGRMSVYVNVITIARTMNLLLRGGVKIVQALEITSATLANLVYREEMLEISKAVQGGEPMSRSMIANPRLFPSTFSQMAAVGENTGKLDETLVFLADFYETELDSATKNFSNILEPAMLLIMGGVVVFVAISIITPIYSMSQTLGR